MSISFNEIHYKQTLFGFEYGPATIERIACDPEKGWVCLGVETKKAKIEIQCSKSGMISIALRAEGHETIWARLKTTNDGWYFEND